MSRVERTRTRIAGFQSPEMDFQLMRSLGAASFGGGEVGEIFAARAAMGSEDPRAWPPSFAALADRLRAAGEDAARRGQRVSASARATISCAPPCITGRRNISPILSAARRSNGG